MKFMKFIPEYEAMTGEKVSPEVARLAELMDSVGQRFEAKGYEDASQGLTALSNDVFQTWGINLFLDDAAMAETMADLARIYYMDGYRKGGAA